MRRQAAKDVQPQVSPVDPTTDQVSESVVRPVPGVVPGAGRACFDVTVPASSGYRVSVASFSFVTADVKG